MINLLLRSQNPIMLRAKEVARRVVGVPVRRAAYWAGAVLSYSQHGEDLVLADAFFGKREGFYVDIGSFHPITWSNTWAFYRRGWRGICIDPTPGMSGRFARLRPRDTHIECAVLNEVGKRPYFMYEHPAHNGLNEESAKFLRERGSPKLLEVRDVPVRPLREIFAEQRVPDIDFISIDVEGNEQAVLESNDWERYRPRVVAFEIGGDGDAAVHAAPAMYLAERDYRWFAMTTATLFMYDARRGLPHG